MDNPTRETKTSPVSPIKLGPDHGRLTTHPRPQHAYLTGNVIETGTDSYRLARSRARTEPQP